MAKKGVKRVQSKIDSERHGFAGAILFALITLIISLIAKFTQDLGQTTNILMDLFGNLGYDLTLIGILFGIIYSFIAGFIFCYLYAFIYNKLPSKK